MCTFGSWSAAASAAWQLPLQHGSCPKTLHASVQWPGPHTSLGCQQSKGKACDRATLREGTRQQSPHVASFCTTPASPLIHTRSFPNSAQQLCSPHHYRWRVPPCRSVYPCTSCSLAMPAPRCPQAQGRAAWAAPQGRPAACFACTVTGGGPNNKFRHPATPASVIRSLENDPHPFRARAPTQRMQSLHQTQPSACT